MIKYHKNKKNILFHKTIIYLCNLVSMKNVIQKQYINHIKTCFYDPTICKKVEIFLIYIYEYINIYYSTVLYRYSYILYLYTSL